MALLIKTIVLGYNSLMNDVADPRANDFFLMSSPFPLIGILALWTGFIFKWGPEYMKDKEPWNLKRVMIAYNIVQVTINLYLVYEVWSARHLIDWRCSEVDYSRGYWGMRFLQLTHVYFLLKLVDLIDTVFFVLRKKSGHLSFLHLYHHSGMTVVAWIGTKFMGGGHVYFLGLANCTVHAILYGYYLLTAYDSKYSKLVWLKKFITQAQLFQFVFLLFMYGQLVFWPNCKFPKIASLFMVPQSLFMIILFGDFYIKTYHLTPRRRKKELEEKTKMQKLQKMQEKNECAKEKNSNVVF